MSLWVWNVHIITLHDSVFYHLYYYWFRNVIICIGVSNIITNTEELIQNGIGQLIAEAFAFSITRSLIKPSFKLTLQILSRHNLNNELWQVCGKCLFFFGSSHTNSNPFPVSQYSELIFITTKWYDLSPVYTIASNWMCNHGMWML